MEIKSNWLTIVKKAWSMRFMALTAVCATITLVTSLLPTLIKTTPSGAVWLAVLTLVFTFLGMWSRVVAQKGFEHGD